MISVRGFLCLFNDVCLRLSVSQERLMDEGIDDDDSGEEGAGGGGGGGGPDDQAQAAAPAAVLPEPNFLTTAWSFISTFFTSLIPEGRPHPAN